MVHPLKKGKHRFYTLVSRKSTREKRCSSSDGTCIDRIPVDHDGSST